MIEKIYSFLVRPRYSPLATVIFVLFPLIALWWYDSIMWRSPLPSVQVEDERGGPSTVSFRKDYTFTEDWFSKNIPVWKRVLSPYLGQPNLRYLEIGVYEGMSVLWMLENVLTDETAHLTGIDPFLGDYKQRFSTNLKLSGYSEKTSIVEGFSQVVLRDLPLGSFDIIYIDGSHASRDLLEDAVLSWRLLKEGGILIFDDYRWLGLGSPCQFDSAADSPKTAIDSFTVCFRDELEVIHNSYQLIIRKIALS